jgi:hypothetical protein
VDTSGCDKKKLYLGVGQAESEKEALVPKKKIIRGDDGSRMDLGWISVRGHADLLELACYCNPAWQKKMMRTKDTKSTRSTDEADFPRVAGS